MIDIGLDLILTIVVLSFWFLFPIGMFLAVSHLDKLREAGTDAVTAKTVLRKRKSADYNRRRPTLIPH